MFARRLSTTLRVPDSVASRPKIERPGLHREPLAMKTRIGHGSLTGSRMGSPAFVLDSTCRDPEAESREVPSALQSQ